MSYLDKNGVNKLWSKAKEKFATTSDVSGKANLAGNNTFTGGQTITGNNDGYSINASGYVKGSWLQAPSTGKAGSNTGKVCVLDSSGWIYYRTPAEIVSDGGGATKATTLSGYGITDAYTKTETNNLINSKTKTVVFDTYDKFIQFLEDTSQATYDYFNVGDSIYIKEGGANYWISGKEDIVEGGYSYNRIISGRTGSDLLGTDNIYRKTVTVNIGTTYTSVEVYEVKPQSEAGYSNFSWNSSTGDVKITLESLRPNTEVTVTLKTYTPASPGGEYGYYNISNIGPTKVSELTNDSGYLTTLAAKNKYVDLTNTQTITGTKSFTSGLKVSGRVANSGDDEGIVVNTASNGYAGVCLGTNSGERSVFYFNNSHQAFWRYNNGTTSYDIHHPKKSGTIATIDDIPTGSAVTGTIGQGSSLEDITNRNYFWIVYPNNPSSSTFTFSVDSNFTAYHFAIIQGGTPGSVRYFNSSTVLKSVVTTYITFTTAVNYIKFKIG